MNHLQQQQEQQENPSFLEWYSNKTGIVMDNLCFSCANVYPSEIQDFDGVSTYEEQKEHMRRCYASYEIPGDFQDYSIHRKETLPIQNIWGAHSLLQANSFIDDDDDDDDDAPLEHAPLSPTKPSIFRENSRDSLDVFYSHAFEKPMLHPPISPSDTYTTISMSMSLSDDEDEDDEEDRRSTTSDEAMSQLFRPKQLHATSSTSSSSSLKDGANDHESYGYLLRMKPQNYMHGGGDEEDRIGFQQRLRPAYRNNGLPYSLEDIGNAEKLRSDTLKNHQGWDRANSILETTTGKLPTSIENGIASLVVKPTQNTVQARSA
jgi:hypothetical protein